MTCNIEISFIVFFEKQLIWFFLKKDSQTHSNKVFLMKILLTKSLLIKSNLPNHFQIGKFSKINFKNNKSKWAFFEEKKKLFFCFLSIIKSTIKYMLLIYMKRPVDFL